MISWVNPPNIEKINNAKLRLGVLEKSGRETLPKALHEAAYSVIINRQKNITRKENY